MPSKILDIELKTQCSDNWCYAAVIEAINKFYKLPELSQKSIAHTFPDPQGMQDPYNILNSLNVINKSQGAFGVKKGIPSWIELVNNINNNRPIISKVGKHYILLIGYDGNSSRDPQRKYIFLDPLLGSENGIIYVTYETLKDNGFSTNYMYTGKASYENYIGSLFTKPNNITGGTRTKTRIRTRTRKIHKNKF